MDSDEISRTVINPAPSALVATLEDAEIALDCLRTVTFDVILENPEDVANEVAAACFGLWCLPGVADSGSKRPAVLDLLGKDYIRSWGDVLRLLPAFVADMERHVESIRHHSKMRAPARDLRPDDEEPVF